MPIIYGLGFFYGFEPLTVVSGSSLAFGLERESLAYTGLALTFVATIYLAALGFRKKSPQQGPSSS